MPLFGRFTITSGVLINPNSSVVGIGFLVLIVEGDAVGFLDICLPGEPFLGMKREVFLDSPNFRGVSALRFGVSITEYDFVENECDERENEEIACDRFNRNRPIFGFGVRDVLEVP